LTIDCGQAERICGLELVAVVAKVDSIGIEDSCSAIGNTYDVEL